MAKNDVELRDKLLLSAAETATILNTSVPTLKEMVKAGLIRRLEIKGVTKFYIKELHEFCERMMDKGIDPVAPVDEIIRNLT